MVDIHSHILHGMDDGAKTFEDSLAMVLMAAENGTTDIVATPHCNHEFKFRPELISERIAALRQGAGDRIRIHRGCDFHLAFDSIEEAMTNPRKFSINHLGYLLVEFPDFQIFDNTSQIFDNLMLAGLKPIITHPERNTVLQQRLPSIREWVERGCYVQVTAQSLLGRFGQTARKFAEELLSQDLVHFLASDAHDLRHRPTRLDEARERARGGWGDDIAEALFETNPRATLTGAPLSVAPPKKAGRKWFKFWA
ncbi:MAG: exopolysaccharide biosynthesis protein [Acidobacteria bacterium]|nr:exopolysaccharide biosynthesis protein [Acidobacteriota bacterium]